MIFLVAVLLVYACYPSWRKKPTDQESSTYTFIGCPFQFLLSAVHSFGICLQSSWRLLLLDLHKKFKTWKNQKANCKTHKTYSFRSILLASGLVENLLYFLKVILLVAGKVVSKVYFHCQHFICLLLAMNFLVISLTIGDYFTMLTTSSLSWLFFPVHI